MSAADAVTNDMKKLSYSVLAPYDNGSDKIKHSLNLISEGECGSTILWHSSDTDAITHGGRVIRGKFYEKDREVTLTATVTSGYFSLKKDFKFVVLKDEAWKDPCAMSDEEFFGIYEKGTLVERGKLDYSYLPSVEDAVKKGDIPLAKEKLMAHFASRKPKSEIQKSVQNKLWAEALLDDFYHLQSGLYFQGDLNVGNEWGTYKCEITAGNIARGGVSSFGIRSRYNECTFAEIKRCTDENIQNRPKIEMLVDGVKKEYFAIDDALIRAGEYKSTCYGNEKTLRVQTFGDFLGNDTYHTLFKFDFSDLTPKAQISDIKFVVMAKSYPHFAGEKRLIVLKEPSNTWSGKTAVWNDFLGCVYSYNGLPQKNDWTVRPEGSDIEYQYQMCRFNGYVNGIIPLYLETGDEEYMYKMLSILNDYINDTASYTMSDTKNFDPAGIRGGFIRSLDAAIKNEHFMAMLEIIAKSHVTTPELFTGLLKNIWDTAHFLSIYNTPYNNWRQSEFQSLLQTCLKVPEFYDVQGGEKWYSLSIKELEDILFLNNLGDGSYSEAACGYSFSAFSLYVKHKRKMEELGVLVSEEYDKLLHKCAYYIALLFTPDGRQLQYGDNGVGAADMSIFDYICDCFSDEELRYIVSRGKKGKKPSFTSKLFKDSMVTAMRNGWDERSQYLFTNTRGGGAHGHCDYNGVIVCAGGRTLLNDAGIFTYTGTDLYRRWGVSTVAHNTVLINDTSQIHVENAGVNPTGKIYSFVTNDKFDFLSQSTPNNIGFEHRRSIFFLKGEMWIVSDLLIPEDKEKTNNYKQLWHMLPSANLKTSEKQIYSEYDSGTNIIVANADDDASVKSEMGYYDQSYQQIQNAPYGYFEKNMSGDAMIDTVIFPYDEGECLKIAVKRIETEKNATALLIEFEKCSKLKRGYYYLAYEKGCGNFGKYSTDAMVAYIEEDKEGNVTHFIIEGGTYIKNNENGNVLKN